VTTVCEKANAKTSKLSNDPTIGLKIGDIENPVEIIRGCKSVHQGFHGQKFGKAHTYFCQSWRVLLHARWLKPNGKKSISKKSTTPQFRVNPSSTDLGGMPWFNRQAQLGIH